MPDIQTPIQSQSARFVVGGAKQGQGFLLLYPDNLTAVNSPVDTWGYLVGPLIFLAFSVPLFHTIGWGGIAAGSAIGGGIGNLLNRRRAVRKATAGGDGVTVIPLDLITGVRSRKPEGRSGWWGIRILVVTTADGIEYEFRGTLDKWQAHLARALTERGREVYEMPGAITVTPRVMPGEG